MLNLLVEMNVWEFASASKAQVKLIIQRKEKIYMKQNQRKWYFVPVPENLSLLLSKELK